MLHRGVSIIFLYFTCYVANAVGQNPFDIKKSNSVSKESPKPKSNPPGNKPVTSSPPQQISQPPHQNEPANPNTKIQAATTQKSKSPNIFDIKAGGSSQIILNNPGSPETINTFNNSAGTKSNNTNASSSKTTSDTQNLNVKTEPTQAESFSNPGVNNPFNIIPPSGQQAGQQANPGSSSSTRPTVLIPDIKKEISQIKDVSANSQGVISKNIWFIIYVFLFLLAAVAINFNRAYPMSLIKATYNQNQLRILFKDAFKGNHLMIFGILYFLFIINAGIFLYHSFNIFHIAPMSLLFAIGIVWLVYLVRHLVLLVLGAVFPLTKETVFFSYTIGIHNLTLGLALMMINIILSFVDPETGKMLIFSGLSITISLYLLRQARGLLNNISTILGHKFHFILYLCTVEIAPWMLLSGILLNK